MPISYCSEWTTASGKIRRAYPGGVEKEVGYTFRGEKIYYNEWTRLQLHVPCHSGDETEDSADGGSDSLATVPPTPAYDWRQPKDYSQNTYSPTPSNRINPEESAARVLGSKAIGADMQQQLYRNNPVLAAMLGTVAGDEDDERKGNKYNYDISKKIKGRSQIRGRGGEYDQNHCVYYCLEVIEAQYGGTRKAKDFMKIYENMEIGGKKIGFAYNYGVKPTHMYQLLSTAGFEFQKTVFIPQTNEDIDEFQDPYLLSLINNQYFLLAIEGYRNNERHAVILTEMQFNEKNKITKTSVWNPGFGQNDWRPRNWIFGVFQYFIITGIKIK